MKEGELVNFIRSYGFISSIKYDSLTPWYTLTSNNEVIAFIDADGNQRQLNSLFIEAENTSLFIRILPSDYCIYIPANGSRSIDLQKIESIQVMNNLGSNIRWSGQFF